MFRVRNTGESCLGQAWMWRGAIRRVTVRAIEGRNVRPAPRNPANAKGREQMPAPPLVFSSSRLLSAPAVVRQNDGRSGLNQGTKPALAARASPIQMVAVWKRAESLVALRMRAAPMCPKAMAMIMMATCSTTK